jgi:uncharacterized phage infection (PIP) family protein YhgE
VRSLAQRSADAAKEIKELITASVERVGQGSVLVDKAGVTMTEVVQAIRSVTEIMGEISAASSEQSAGVNQIGEAVTQMDQATQQNAALVEEMAAAANALNNQAAELVKAVSVFTLSENHTQPASHLNPVRAPSSQPSGQSLVMPKNQNTEPARIGASAFPKAPVKQPQLVDADSSKNDWESF